jgi:hypothetical protein
MSEDVIRMKLPEEIITRFKKKGGRYGADFEQLNARINADHKIALKGICVKEGWNLGNVVDWLIEGFIADYRQMWPVDGVYQTQLSTEWAVNVASEDEPLEEDKEPVPQSKFEREHPDYLYQVMPLRHQLRRAVEEGRWLDDVEKALLKIAHQTNEQWTKDVIEQDIANFKQRLDDRNANLSNSEKEVER